MFNDEYLEHMFNQTEYGGLLYSSSLVTNVNPSENYFTLDSAWNTSSAVITLSTDNYKYSKDFKYKQTLQKIIDYEKINSIIKLDTKSGNSYKYLKITGISYPTPSIGDNSWVNFNVEQIDYFGEIPYDNEEFNIDFILEESLATIGDLSGSFTGSFAGSAELTGSFFGQFEGLLDGTASRAGYALTSSFTENASTVEVFLKSKNWTKPSWAKTIRVTCIGGGGGGGAAPATETSGIVAGGGGGGGGTITIGEFDADTLPSTISVTIGAGGNGGVYDGVILKFASNGGDTYFGDYLIARGGNHGFNGGVESLRALGGSTIANIEYKNTGAGGGGAGTVEGNISNIPAVFDASMAPPLPLPREYMITSLDNPEYNYYIVIPTPIPAVIAPTGGGGGLGYDPDNGGRQDGVTTGGSISEYSLTNNKNKYKSLTPILYNSSSYEYYPGFNSKVGLGGKGGNPYLLAGPTDGTMYGGGGGGAYGGGVDGIYANGQLNGTEYNFGANGAIGAVIIISEA
jgi:hypothetical protein